MSVVETAKETAYQAGDLVLMRKDLQVGEFYGMFGSERKGYLFNCLMGNLGLKIVEINKVEPSGRYYDLFEGSGYSYVDEMFAGKILPINNYEELKAGDKLVVSHTDETVIEFYNGAVIEYISSDGELVSAGLLGEDGNYGLAIFHKSSILGLLHNPTNLYCELTPEDENCSDGSLHNEALAVGVVAVEKEIVEVVEAVTTDVINEEHVTNFPLHVVKIIFSNPATIVFYKTAFGNELADDDKIRKIVAKANGTDVYDKGKGLDIAMFKAYQRESARILKKLSK